MSTALTLALLAGASFVSFSLGWVVRRASTSGRDAALKRSMYETKGAIPQLEASLRSRDQRIAMVQAEAEALRSKLTALESTLAQKDADIVKRDREVRRLASELQINQESGAGEEAMAVLEGAAEDASVAPPELEARLKKAEARYEALKRGLIARDDKIAALEDAVRDAQKASGARALERELEELNQSAQNLGQTLAVREGTVKDLEARVQREAEQREVLETLAKRRGDANRELKEKLAKLEQQLPKIMETMKARNAAIAQRDGTIHTLGADLEHARAECTARDGTIAGLEADVATARDALAAHESRLLDMERGARGLEARIENLVGDLDAARDATARAEVQVRERDAAVLAERARVEAAEGHVHEHEQSIVSLERAIRDREFRVDTLTADLARVSTALETARRDSASANATQADVTGKLATEAKQARERAELLARQNDTLSKEVASRERRQSELEAERTRLLQRVSALEAPGDGQVHVLESQLAAARARCERAEDELLQAARENKTLRGLVAALESAPRPDDDDAAPLQQELPLQNHLAADDWTTAQHVP